MRAPDGRGFIRDGVGEQLRAGRKADDILQRRLDRQPKIPDPVAATGATWADAYSETVRDNGSGYPSFADWTFFDDDDGQIGMTSSGDANGTIFDVPAGLYMAKIVLSINVTSPQADFSMSCNVHSPSAFVTHEFPVNLYGTSHHAASYTIGPLPALEGQGRMSVSFYYPVSPGVPVLSGSCTYILAKIG